MSKEKELYVDTSIHEKLGMKILTYDEVEERKRYAEELEKNKCEHEYEYDGGQCNKCGEQGGILTEERKK